MSLSRSETMTVNRSLSSSPTTPSKTVESSDDACISCSCKQTTAVANTKDDSLKEHSGKGQKLKPSARHLASMRRGRGRGRGRGRRRRKPKKQIPDSILKNEHLKKSIQSLPSHYNFEIYKTIWKIQEHKAKKVALQFPEGLLLFSCVISDILEQYAGVECVIMGDVTYGACCVDDFTARSLGCDFLVHYGHSCLVPIDVTDIRVLYVFVDIQIDSVHLVETIKHNFPPSTRLYMLGTIQFAGSMYIVKTALEEYFKEGNGSIAIPQCKPLSAGEVLGCTSPIFDKSAIDAFIFVADGRFHLESVLIHNPGINAYQYNPYKKILTSESYDIEKMKSIRKDAVENAATAKKFGLILGTLGRQGNTNLLERLQKHLRACGKEYTVVLLSEIFPSKLQRFADIDAWIQIACPRLSIDWGYAFPKPLLNPYEAECALNACQWRSERYPMDFYAHGGGEWTNYYKP